MQTKDEILQDLADAMESGRHEDISNAAQRLGEYESQAEIDGLRDVIREAYNLFADADKERLAGVHNAHAEAEKWKAEGDMYGWNFHQGKASGMTEASIIFARAFRRLKAAMEAAE